MAYVKFDNTKYYIGEQVIVIERISSYWEEPVKVTK
jgi:hypothetical protein